MCEPRRLTIQWASTACYRDSFYWMFLTYMNFYKKLSKTWSLPRRIIDKNWKCYSMECKNITFLFFLREHWAAAWFVVWDVEQFRGCYVKNNVTCLKFFTTNGKIIYFFKTKEGVSFNANIELTLHIKSSYYEKPHYIVINIPFST
jgi:hypothetical protein